MKDDDGDSTYIWKVTESREKLRSGTSKGMRNIPPELQRKSSMSRMSRRCRLPPVKEDAYVGMS